MRDDHREFLRLLGQLPARLTAEQAAWVLNCQAHDVPVLVSARLLKPLANPAHNSIKFFATSEVLESAKDRAWLVRVTATVNSHWHKMNARKKIRSVNGSENGLLSRLNLTEMANGKSGIK